MVRRFLIVENIKNPIILELKVFHNNSNYMVFLFSELKSKLSKKILSKLLKSGLFMTNKDRDKYNPLVAFHRLVVCIKTNINGLTIHHIDKNKQNNSLDNLLPTTQTDNNEFELLEEDVRLQKGKSDLLNYKIQKSFNESKHKRTLSNNEELHKDIISFSLNNSIQKTIARFNNKIKTSQTIRSIIHYYFYAKDFLNWLKVHYTKV
ncbi:hypothetical protein IKQ26_00765 [bacterium]|nr:hypothetical protein [bacterium]